MDLLLKLNYRYATKVFDPNKKVSQSDLDNLLEAIRLSASSYGLQPYKVLVVTDPAIRAQLREVAWGQPQITDSSALLVFAARTDVDASYVDHFVETIAKVRNAPVEALADYSNMMKGSVSGMDAEGLENWNSKQAYIALGFGLVSAAVMGLDACPMEGFNPAEFDRILNLEAKNLKSKVLMAVGYRSSDDKYQQLTKVRFPKDELFVHV